MAEAPAVNETLTPDDTVDVLEELLPAQNKSYELGLKLKLPQHVVEAIHSKELSPDKYLLNVLIRFLQQVEPRPTWRAIVKALRNPIVNLPALARRVEVAHFPNPTATRDVVAETTDTESAANSNASDDEVKSKTPSQPSPATEGPTSVGAVQALVKVFRRRFKALQMSTIRCLEKCKITVMMVLFTLTSIKAVKEHKVFLEEKHKALRQSADHLEMFSLLNLYWNYLSYHVLDQLIEALNLEEPAFDSVAAEMAVYKKDLHHFMRQTLLVLFCEAETRTLDEDPPPGFRKMVVKLDWPETTTLEDVEKFRRRYASSYDLRTCAMMVNSVRTGSFTSTDQERSTKKKVLKDPKLQVASSYVSHSSMIIDSTAKKRIPGEASAVKEDYPFAEQPSDDFFCPVMMGLLLEPHLTSCCGKHLSQEAATRIQREGGACPLCNEQSWSTVLNKHFQRQVNSLRVFCHHEDRGCGWQGGLAAFHHHVESCPMRDGPLMTELVKLPVDGARAMTSSQVARIEVIGERKVRVTNEGQLIDWEDYGLNIHIPPNSLPDDCSELELEMTVSRPQHYKLPTENGILVSAVYSFHHNLGDRKLRQSATVEMQHCVNSSSYVPLCIVQSDDITLPYQFRIQPGGKFHHGRGGYGSVELDHFCSFGVYLQFYAASLIWNLKPCAALYYTNIRPRSFHFHLYLAPHLNAALKEIDKDVREKNASFERGAVSLFEFQEKSKKSTIELDLSSGPQSKWILKDLNNKKIKAEDIVNMRSFLIPFQVRVRWAGGEGEPVTPLEYDTVLTGAADHHLTVVSPDDCVSSELRSPSATPKDFMFFPKPELADLVETVGMTVQSKWKAIGLRLGLTQPQLNSIQQSHQGSVHYVQDCMTDVFHKWCEGNTSEYSWRNLAEVLCSQMVNMPQILGDIHAKLITKHDYK